MLAAHSMLVSLLFAVIGGCGDHYSTQEANSRCQQERRTKNTLNDDSFKECVACFEDCGAECKALALSPEQYRCPD